MPARSKSSRRKTEIVEESQDDDLRGAPSAGRASSQSRDHGKKVSESTKKKEDGTAHGVVLTAEEDADDDGDDSEGDLAFEVSSVKRGAIRLRRLSLHRLEANEQNQLANALVAVKTKADKSKGLIRAKSFYILTLLVRVLITIAPFFCTFCPGRTSFSLLFHCFLLFDK